MRWHRGGFAGSCCFAGFSKGLQEFFIQSGAAGLCGSGDDGVLVCLHAVAMHVFNDAAVTRLAVLWHLLVRPQMPFDVQVMHLLYIIKLPRCSWYEDSMFVNSAAKYVLTCGAWLCLADICF